MTERITTDITEGNKLIAEFIGRDWRNETKWEMSYEFAIPKEVEYPLSEHDLEYHESWNDLMPVVEKIEKEGFEVHIHSDGCYLKRWFYKGNVPDIGAVRETKIEAVWNTCVQFIIWYNNSQNKQQ